MLHQMSTMMIIVPKVIVFNTNTDLLLWRTRNWWAPNHRR